MIIHGAVVVFNWFFKIRFLSLISLDGTAIVPACFALWVVLEPQTKDANKENPI